MQTTLGTPTPSAIGFFLSIVALTLPLFLNPVWVAFEQGRSQAGAWAGFTEPELRAATDSILGDLVIGPPEFEVAIAGAPVLNERERGHMRDVRGVFIGFFAVTALLIAAALAIHARRRRGAERAGSWGAVRTGSLALIAALIGGGVLSVIAFDTVFEVFHRIFFAGGSYTFDPSTERLVQLFPLAFWQETALAVAAVCIVLAVLVAVVANRRATATTMSPAGDGASPSSLPAAGPTR